MKLPIRRPWIPYIILIISLIITCLGTLYVMHNSEDRDRLRFQNAVEQTQNSIDNRIETYIALLRGSGALFAARDSISQDEFRSYVTRLNLNEQYPGIQGIGYAPMVTSADKESFTATINSEGQPNFSIRPAGNRSMYFPIVYLEPEDSRNQRAIGFDMYSETIRNEAMNKARDTGLRAASAKVSLVQLHGETRQAGFLIYVPLYQGNTVPATFEERRQQLKGFVYSPFRVDDLLTGIIGNGTQQLIHFQIYDGEKVDASKLLHDSQTVTGFKSPTYKPIFEQTTTLSVAGRTWTMVFSNYPQFEAQSQQGLAPFIFISGLLISAVVFFLSRSQYLARTAAEQFVNKLSYSQRELKKAVGIRDNFISIASHELKTPVTSLKVYAEVLHRQFKQKGQHKEAQYMEKMGEQIDKLTMLIHDLLDVTRLQSGKLSLRREEIDLSKVVKEVVESMKPTVGSHTIVFKSTTNAIVNGDKDRLGQVVSNFLTNAIKYSPHADRINVTVSEDAKGVKVSVQDFGIGIAKQYQNKIFNRFYRVGAPREQTFPGLGMGLYICSEIIKRHGGEIMVESVHRKGSIFSFSIPFKQKSV
jgi:signal transduction histidine kinase